MSRRREASAVPRKMTPEQIAVRSRPPGEVMAGKEWIDQSVRADRRAGGPWYRHRRRRGKQPKGRGGRHAGRGHIPGRVDMAERPSVVEAKSRVGDWEFEPIVEANTRAPGCRRWTGGRNSRPWADRGETAAVTETIVRRMVPFRDRGHPGKAFAGHRKIAGALGADCYFATPYHAWERGLNEQTHGLVRQSFPKGTDFRQVTVAQVRAVEDRINRRSRKGLGVRAPQEVSAEALAPPWKVVTHR